MSNRISSRAAFIAAILLAAVAPPFSAADDPVRFSLQIRPILADNCYHCHGPDETHREAELRLDDEASAKAKRDEGAAIVPGKPDESALVKRIASSDPDVVMPPPDTNKQLKPEQVALLKKWIEQGASWGKHWSFEPPQKMPLPEVKQKDWPQSPIDHFVLAELEKRNLSPAPPADPLTLCRRISLDVIGLPLSPEEADAFAAAFSKDRPAAVRELVDRLLNSPRFGEHWARMWLDLARHADTKGYEKDLHRDMWPYRDWVIEALNADMPLDQFTREQLAGDLLDGTGERQIIATAFHRNTMTNDEGGTDDEEFRMTAVKDRIDTTVQVWMGLTMGCAKCHSHKYDPLTHTDYYRFYAIFNQTEDNDRFDDGPTLPLPTSEQKERRQKLDEQVAALKIAMKKEEDAAAGLAAEDEKKWQPYKPSEAKSTGGATLTVQDDVAILVEGTSPETDVYDLTLRPGAGKFTALRIEALPSKFPSGKQGLGRNPDDPNFVISELILEQVADGKEPVKLKLTNPRADFSQDGWNVTAAIDGDTKTGWAVSPKRDERHVALFDFDPPLEIADGTSLKVSLSQQYGNRLTLARFRLSLSSFPPAELTPVPTTPQLAQLKKELDAAVSQRSELEKQIVKLPIYRELPEGKRRVTKIHNRGNFLDPGDEVQPDVPAAFGPLPEGAPKSRLGVAQWLTSKDNPLTPRVMANRVWARLFGLGIVETEEDFGAQGSPPSHPYLLDWLAVHYRDECRWSLKSLIRSIVASSTYQQA
jgi:mono/diheme cytochrome c family protein